MSGRDGQSRGCFGCLVQLGILVLAAFGVVFLFAAVGACDAQAYPPSTDAQYKEWALRWHKQEVKQDKRYQKMRVALGMSKTHHLTTIADYTVQVGGVDTMSWHAYGAACKARALKLQDSKIPALWKRLTHPKGNGATRWKPLLRYCGMPASQMSRSLKVMWRESRGNPSAKNPSSSASGLYQFLSFWWTDERN